MTAAPPRTPPAILMPSPIDVGEQVHVATAAYHSRRELACYLESLPHLGAERWAVLLGVQPDDPVTTQLTGIRSAVAGPGEAFQAAIGSMMALRPGDGLLLLFPADWDGPAADFLVEQGRRWRATQHAPENGEYHPIDVP